MSSNSNHNKEMFKIAMNKKRILKNVTEKWGSRSTSTWFQTKDNIFKKVTVARNCFCWNCWV